MINYPIPPHKQKALADKLNNTSHPLTQRIHDEELSLPISPLITIEEADYIIEQLNRFVI